MTEIRNPILPGFNPDPSIVRVGDDYYIATSTFEWYPGVQIHHSRDLRNWQLVKRPLERAAQLDMRGDPDSGGIWAPCLTYADGLFWLIYTDVKRRDGAWKDSHNYLVTAPSVEGPWSDPIYLNSSGFDPSLFHDEDGRKWLLNMIWDHNQTGGDRFGGIVCQEYSAEEQRLVGPVHNIYRGTDHKLTEGPHLYRRDGWYYLLTAEGGTGYDHAATMARSRDLLGPYETDPAKHLLTSKDAPGAYLQRAGHADIVETQDGEHYLVHLCSRPLDETRGIETGRAKGIHADDVRRSPLGRETAIQKLVWPKDEFPRLAHGGCVPAASVAAPDLPEHRFEPEPARLTFAPGALPRPLQWLRSPEPERLFSLTERPGALRLFGREAPGSQFDHALVARRQTDLAFTAETEIDVTPGDYQQFAGLISWYGRFKFHYLAVTADAASNRLLTVYSCAADWPDARVSYPVTPIPLPASGTVRLGVDVNGGSLRFRYGLGENGDWRDLGITLDQSAISDEAGNGPGNNFTGAFVGMCAHDTSGRGRPADFLHFTYEPNESRT
ncbi:MULTISPECIES: glycoside hydrolase family 43 protein [unclassified Salipiger]|uniref:glycoside hydrolase family 43 protein n=1 Tax=unclassified Salipiger TaxID=2640570 RepID=UPI0013B5F7CB|nr:MULTISPECIES: glycoside hydrolase family 43 protein [unclassified Salipiger]NDV53699.1 glycoside hydrolase family 43 protein [Salipiger sp. PrR003]NDW35780.1 glycoside hydrolase family 43 protein [Salipiger sp. PrR007]